MMPAHKRPALEPLLAALNRRMLRKHFHRVHAGGLEHVRALDRTRPIIIYGNHSCWWDGLMEFFFSADVFRFDAYLMMEERQLRRYQFFRWIGAFSVNRDSPREALRSVQYAASLFDRPGRVLWIYPQGVMLPNDVRPLGFYGGTARLMELVDGAQILPVAHRYEFLSEQRPEAFSLFGPPVPAAGSQGRRATTARLERVLTELLDSLRCSIGSGQTEGFVSLLEGSSSVNVRYDQMRGAGQR
jgi:1-acyl-sn-glycerol-3-phosphate acyltransferase